jgi:hypothetical protein
LREKASKARRLAELAPEDVQRRLRSYADELDQEADELKQPPGWWLASSLCP